MKRIFCLSFLVIFFSLFASEKAEVVVKPKLKKDKTICLNMIVKNESKVIKRCLASVKHLLDYWVIVDTGSNDGTQEIIKEFMQDIPGMLYEKPWVNFGHNRTEALDLAKDKADYLLFIDADEYLIYADNFTLPPLEADGYFGTVHQYNDIDYKRLLLINNHLCWKWIGVLHEYVESAQATKFATLQNVINYSNTLEGARSADPNKYYKDAEILEKALIEEPNNSRYVFYLAQCYACAGEYDLALKNYEKRAFMSGWQPEVYFSLFSIAKLQQMQNRPVGQVLQSYDRAYRYSPYRAEPLYYTIQYYIANQNWASAYLLAKQAMTISFPDEAIYVEKWIYDYGVLMQFADSAMAMNKIDEAYDAFCKLLQVPNLPLEIKKNVEKNINVLKQRNYH